VTIKTRPSDTRKIEVIRDLIAEHVDVRAIIQAVEIPREVPAAGAQPSSPPPFLIST